MTPRSLFLSAIWGAATLVIGPAAASAQSVEVLHSFSGCSPLGCGEGNDGAHPRSSLVRGPDGALYGTTTDFPTGGLGTIFRITSSGTRTQLFNFSAPPLPVTAPGCFPGWSWPLYYATDGSFYSAAGCGAFGDGTLFRMSTAGAFTKLHDFDLDGSGTSNGGVTSGIVEGSDGSFYGVTEAGAFGYGSAYRLNADGTITTRHDFTFAEGWAPVGNLLLATDGNLYGAATWGGLGGMGGLPCGASGCGTVFRLLPDGSVSVAHAFAPAEGTNPTGNLIQASDGRLYGTNSVGGLGCGTAFGMTLEGGVTLLHAFTAEEGCGPQSGLMQGQDGFLYGTTSSGGAGNLGTVYRLSTTGELTVLHSFSGPDGSRPFGGLVQGDDLHLYGTTHAGGAHDLGVVFRLILPAAAIALLSPNGGERAFVNTPWEVRWDVEGATRVDVFFSRNGGGAYEAVAGCTGLPGSATACLWTPTGPATTQARIRVVATGAASETATDASDASFTVSTAVPAIAVTAPNTAVKWFAGSVQQIKWTHNLGANAFVRIDLSRDGGATWLPVAASVKNTTSTSGTFPWLVTGPPTAAAMVRVAWIDGPVADAGNATFTIVQPTVKVSIPNTAVSWGIGGTRMLSWSHNIPAGLRVRIDLSRDSGSTWSAIASGVTNATSKSGSYNWTVIGPATTAARIRVSAETDPGVSDISDVDFTIAEPFITVGTPNTALSWRVANRESIRFSQNLGPGQPVDLELTRDGGASWEPLATVMTGTALTTAYSWTVTGPATSLGRVRARWAGNPAVADESNVSFTILPRVTVTTPNSNVAWTIGSTRSITWSHNLGASATVNIELSRNGGATWEPIASGVMNSTATAGSYEWVVTGPATNTALVRIVWSAEPTEMDVSNVTFRIQ